MIKKLNELPIAGNRIFLRADLNVLSKKTTEISEYRLKALLPTLAYLRNAGAAKIVLASHVGSPQPGCIDEQLSTKRLVGWFGQHGFEVDFQSDLEQAWQQSQQNNGRMVLLENLRFFGGEKGKNLSFAKQLARLADVYVNDAFGALHRDDASLVLLAGQFAAERRGIGLLVQREMEALDVIKQNPAQPFIIMLGGAKLEDKIPLLECFLSLPEKNRPQSILIGGAVALAFARAQGLLCGAMVFSDVVFEAAKNIIGLAQKAGVRIVLPVDMIGENAKIYAFNQIGKDAVCGDIGPQTCQLFIQEIGKAKTIFVNGTMGVFEQDAYKVGTTQILKAVASVSGTTIIGGGDTVLAVDMLDLHDHYSFVSTGGGATLAYLAAGNPINDLPALKALEG